MPGLVLKVILQDIKKFAADALIVGFHEDIRPLKGLAGELDWLLCGSLSNLVLSNKVRGAIEDVALLTSRGKIPANKIFMIGLGPANGMSAATVRHAAKSAAVSLIGAGLSNAALEYFPALGEAPTASIINALRNGLADGSKGRGLTISLLAPDAASYERLARMIKA